ncbi:MAG: serine/threonine protein kinase, partial [Deltaproteobacteria bacterium]|nr:serine/threonine protein kinase [Deltaproteobacteria bacterium]
MRICPECGERSDAGACPADGCPTVDEELARRPAETAELVGRTFGDRYRVDALLGQGGMGWVFAARHLQMGHPLALKVMRRELLLDFTALRRFRREAQACSRLLHHNTIKVHDFGISADGYPWFVMEYLEGCSLDQELRTRGALPLGRVVRIASQVCRSLQEA